MDGTVSEPGWAWNLPQIYTDLGISELEFAQQTGIRRATLNALRAHTDTFVGVLIAVYHGVQARWHPPRPLTLHDILVVEGQPSAIRVRPRTPLPELVHLPNLPTVYLNTPTLRRELVPAYAPAMTVRSVARACQLSEVTLSRQEHGHMQPRISTLVALYRYFLTINPALTLHDVLLIDEAQPADDPAGAGTERGAGGESPVDGAATHERGQHADTTQD
jgi:DNA-binding XRE family transcriptional regulator